MRLRDEARPFPREISVAITENATVIFFPGRLGGFETRPPTQLRPRAYARLRFISCSPSCPYMIVIVDNVNAIYRLDIIHMVYGR